MEPEESAPLEAQVFRLAFEHPGAIEYFVENLPAEAVGLVTHQTGLHEFYLALTDFYQKTGLDPIDPIAFRSWLESETDLYAALGGVSVYRSFVDAIMDTEVASPEAVVALLRHRWNKRRQLDFLQELQSLVAKKGHRDEEEVGRLAFLTDQIRSLEHELDYSPLASVITANDIASRVDELFELPDFLSTQFVSLNRALGYTADGGFCKGAVHAIIAASGKGKSTLAKCLVNHWVDAGYTTLYVNYEEAVAHWERVLFTQITHHNVYLGTEADQQQQLSAMFRAKMHEWGDRFMVRHDPDTPYFDDLEQWLRDLIGHGERVPDVVVIDTIQSLFMRGSGGKPRWGQYEEMMVRLEKLAKDMHCVLIITAQENANRMKERREVVLQTDTGGSLSIQQKCAVTIFITDKKLSSGDDAEDEFLMELQIPKNRITGSAFKMDPPVVRYDDATKSYYSFDLADSARYNPETYIEVDGGVY